MDFVCLSLLLCVQCDDGGIEWRIKVDLGFQKFFCKDLFYWRRCQEEELNKENLIKISNCKTLFGILWAIITIMNIGVYNLCHIVQYREQLLNDPTVGKIEMHQEAWNSIHKSGFLLCQLEICWVKLSWFGHTIHKTMGSPMIFSKEKRPIFLQKNQTSTLHCNKDSPQKNNNAWFYWW